MSEYVPLPPRYIPESRGSSVPPERHELIRRSSPARSLPSPKFRSTTASPPPPPAIEPAPTPPPQAAHQLAAEALLTMAPGQKPDSTPEAVGSPSVPGPALARNTAEDSRGVKRKIEDETPVRAPSAASAASSLSVKAASDRAFSRSPLAQRVDPAPATASSSPANAPANAPANTASATTAATANTATGNRYSLYGGREPMTSPWLALSQRYNSLGTRRDLASQSPAAKPAERPTESPKPNGLPASSSIPTPSTAAGAATLSNYGHYAIGRRELVEHREQLSQGKKWLEQMLTKTEKMLNMVDNRIALAPNEKSEHELTFEERERARQREIIRLEEANRLEREKRLREQREKERDAARDRLSSSPLGGFFGRDRPIASLAAASTREQAIREQAVRERLAREQQQQRDSMALANRERERSEAERNRDLILASRKVSAISPNMRERSTPGAPAPGATGLPAKINGGAGTSSDAKPTPGAPASAAASGAASGSNAAGTPGIGAKPADGAATKPKSAWDGDPVMAGIALPRREQGLARLGRGLWSF